MLVSLLLMHRTAGLLLCCCAIVLCSDIDTKLIEECCELGSNWALSSPGRTSCHPFPEAFLSNDIVADLAKKENCLSLVDICCGQTSRNEQCSIGRNIARSTGSCSSIRVANGNTEIYTHQKECCECCTLGVFAAVGERNCDMFESAGEFCKKSPECCNVFYTCCNLTQTTSEFTTRKPVMTIGTTLSPTTTVAPDREPIHTPNGICAKFSSALCEHYCHDAPDRTNKFRCTCRIGFELAPNQRNCVESSTPGAACERGSWRRCHETAQCYVDRVSSTSMCRCSSNGYRIVDGFRCQDINECVEGLDNCGSDDSLQICVNTEGGFKCQSTECPANQTFDVTVKTCVGISEGSSGAASCNRNEIFDEATGTCVSSSSPGFRCSRGYVFNVVDGKCEDIDECATGLSNCENGQRCENLAGSYTCRRRLGCGTGYSLQEESQACTDIDECHRGIHNCGAAFTCHNTAGSFRCEYKICPVHGQRLNLTTGECVGSSPCSRGFVWAEYSRRCEDINECLLENPCLPSERCENSKGSFRCVSQSTSRSCYNGFELSGDGNAKCQDIDECARGTHTCQSRDHCSNTQGSYKCNCDGGYVLNSVSNICEDLNECSRTVGQFCNPLNSECVNTPGSFHCKCKPGFESIANGRACQDVNECLTPNICQHTCNNVWGSYQCRCQPGFRLSEDKRSCNDVNECELSVTRGRLCNGFCENVAGSFRCVCPAGYKLSDNGRECLDIDECDEGISGCDGSNNICINTRGGFKCNNVQCPRYFTPSADSISRNSLRCARQTFVCSQGDVECLTAPLSFSYNFLTLRATRIRIPTELFTMRGPDSFPRIQFSLDVKDVEELDRDSIAVTRDHFRLYVDPEEQNVAVVSVVLPIVGSQDIKLQLNMNIYNQNGFFGTATATITIYATTDPWE